MSRRFYFTVSLLLVAALAVGIALLFWNGSARETDRLNAAFNYGLLVGAAVAAAGLFEQVAEARRSRQDGLRPVLVVTEALPQPQDGESPARLVVKNVGPGPALEIRVEAWLAGAIPPGIDDRDEVQAFIDQEGLQTPAAETPVLRSHQPITLAAGTTVSVPVWVWGQRDPVIEPSVRLRFRMTFRDVFGNRFAEPPAGNLGHVWVRDGMWDGDYEPHFR